MGWLKRDLWKAGSAIAGIAIILILMVWVPVSAAGAYEGTEGLATPGTVLATPTEDATVTALNKEKLAQEVQQLKNQSAPDLFSWLRTNAAILISTLVVVVGGLIGLFRWFGDQRDERVKRAEERFQAVVKGLGDRNEEAKLGAAITLRTFLHSGYKQFYSQVFDLAVAHLRLRKADPETKADSDGAIPLNSLSQALITVFKESFPLARREIEKQKPISIFIRGTITKLRFLDQSSKPSRKVLDEKDEDEKDEDEKDEWFKSHIRFLDASHIRLDSAFLRYADLKYVQMRNASLSGADLRKANLSHAYLSHANLSGANLRHATLCGAWLHHATLHHANLRDAVLNGAYLKWANFDGAHLKRADLRGADFDDGAQIEGAVNLRGADLRGAKGLTKEQLERCKKRGAIIDEDPTTSPPQSPVSPAPTSQSTDTQAQSTPSVQVSTPTPDTDGRSEKDSMGGNGP